MNTNIFISNLVSYLVGKLDIVQNDILQNDFNLSIDEKWSIWRQTSNMMDFLYDQLKDETNLIPWRLIKLKNKLDETYFLLDKVDKIKSVM
jgi:hypothetical protein